MALALLLPISVNKKEYASVVPALNVSVLPAYTALL